MEIRFYNTLTHRKEVFTPLEAGHVRMYNCGPTVYDYAHIGNFRAFVFADVLRRFLELSGDKVDQVMNITDVGHMTDDTLADGGGEDKMQVAIDRLKSAKKAGSVPDDAVADPNDPYQVAKFFTRAFREDARRLGLKIADDPSGMMPRATEHIGDMKTLISDLIERGHAYVAQDGAVYYSVESFPDYGQLSGNTLDRLRKGAGGRVQTQHQTHKRHPADFLLWKPDASHLMKWDSPWGTGYPGWHIECSAMAMALHGRRTIDIHTGGEDNIFPHHECEIAQSTGATGKPFANFWMHTRFLLVEGEKMSKSKGNFFTVRDVLEGKVTGKPVDPAVLRYELLKTHYRSNMNFTAEGLESSRKAVRRLQDARHAPEIKIHEERIKKQQTYTEIDLPPVNYETGVMADFRGALADDLNMSGALGAVFAWLNTKPPATSKTCAILLKIDEVIGIGKEEGLGVGTGGFKRVEEELELHRQTLDSDAMEVCQRIGAARAKKDFKTSDALRKELEDAGYEVNIGKDQFVSARKR